MIKLFRNIRQKLLAEGNTAKYLKYAVGEIVLVVIGILIALSINNWNENEKANKIEEQYLLKLNNDISLMRRIYDKLAKNYPSTIDSAEKGLKYLESKGESDNLKLDFTNTLLTHQTLPSYPEINTTFNEMISLGVLARIKNETLKSNITFIYNLINEGNKSISYFRDELGRASESIYKEVVFSYKDKDLIVSYNVEELYSNKHFINAIVEIIDARQDYYSTIKKITPLLNETNAMLKKELRIEEND
ncbi:DUF6090 family protein [Seonamhaeicola maritimus]|uniref:DUF6090 family protein n=1 Tax=Seonamhaeicola maritimus TaxID=2591822 RepID=UPI0024949C3D|nr:DUF6090 family protein [Seonamhaeicola maritimus]